MEQCLIDNKICSEQNRKCKVCKLNSCHEVERMIEDEQKWIDRDNLKKLKDKLPEECRNCNMLEIINLVKQKVHCAYRIKNRCILGYRGNDNKYILEKEKRNQIGFRSIR